MALEPSNIQVKMTAGVDEKSDPKSLQTKMTILQNASFQSPGQYQKRDGFATMPPLSAGVGISTFKNELLSLDGSNIFSYSQDLNSQVNKGLLIPARLASVTPVVNSIGSQSQPDSAYDPVSGLRCYCYTDTTKSSTISMTNPAPFISYSVIDSNTGTILVNDVSIANYGGFSLAPGIPTIVSKVAKLGAYFVIVYSVRQSSGQSIVQYAYIPIANPTTITTGNVITTTGSVHIDCGISANGSLYIAYADNVGVGVSSLSPTLVLSSVYHFVGAGATGGNYVAIKSDASDNQWVAFNDSSGNKIGIVDSTLSVTVLAPTQFDAVNKLVNVTMLISGTTATVYSEVSTQAASSSNQAFSDWINSYQITLAGTVTPGAVVMKGVGIAGKVFSYNGLNYILSVYDGGYVAQTYSTTQVFVPTSFQPTYFLLCVSGILGSAKIILKVAPSLAGGYYRQGVLPEIITLGSGNFTFPYVLEERASAQDGSVTFQTGILNALISFLNPISYSKVEDGNNLHLAAGQLWMYDGQNIVEHGFHIYPENLESLLQGSGGSPEGLLGIGASTATLNQVQHVFLYEWVDEQGQLHRSAPSIPVTTKFPSKADTTARTFLASSTEGSNVLVVVGGGVPQLVGAVIDNFTVPAVFASGVFITGIHFTAGVNDGYTVSQNATSTSAGDTYESFDVFAIEIEVPTLRQTNKTNVSIVAFRTVNNGSTFFRVTTPDTSATISNISPAYNPFILNDPTVDLISFIDRVSDSQIVGNEQLYTTGGELENIAAPATSALTTFKNRVIYLSPENPFQWGYSKQIINGAPAEFNSQQFVANVDQRIGQIMAAKSMDDKLILFGPTSKYYVVGQGPTPNGTQNDFSEATQIAGVAGCSNQQSIVEIPEGLMYQDSVKGVYLIDRKLNEVYIGADVEAFNGFTITSVQKFETQNKVIFTLNTGTNLIYDWFVKQWEVDPFPASVIDSAIYNNNLTYIQPNGVILKQTPGVYSDNGSVIPMQLQTGWIPFTGLEGFGRVWEMQIMGTYFSPHTLTVTIYNDFKMTPVQTVVIPVLTNPGQYQFRIRIAVQKLEAMMVNITESQSGSPGQGFALSSLAFRVGVKKGLDKLPAGQSY